MHHTNLIVVISFFGFVSDNITNPPTVTVTPGEATVQSGGTVTLQ